MCHSDLFLFLFFPDSGSFMSRSSNTDNLPCYVPLSYAAEVGVKGWLRSRSLFLFSLIGLSLGNGNNQEYQIAMVVDLQLKSNLDRSFLCLYRELDSHIFPYNVDVGYPNNQLKDL